MEDESALLKEAIQWLDIIMDHANSAQFMGANVNAVIPDRDRLIVMGFVKRVNAILKDKTYK